MNYHQLLEQWRQFAREQFKTAPDAVKREIVMQADKVFDAQFPSLSRASETGRKVASNLRLIGTLDRLGLQLPTTNGDLRPIPSIPESGKERLEWKGRINRALDGLTSGQHMELQDEIMRRTRGPVNADCVADEVRAQFTQIGG